MARILDFIVKYMSFLWAGARFKIVGSEVATSNGGDALLLVESDGLRLMFVCDRTQLELELQPARTSTPKEWFSIDLVRRMFLGEREESALLNESYALFFRDHLDEIELKFSAENWEATRAELRKIMKMRSKELFG